MGQRIPSYAEGVLYKTLWTCNRFLEGMRVTIKNMRWAVVIGFALSSGVAMAAGNIEAGRAKAAMCMSCHGAEGISAVPSYPNLAGQKEAYLVKALNEYKDGQRNNAVMKAMVAPLNAADIENLSAYFSSLKPGK